MNPPIHRSNAFTLVELMVSVVILGILGAIAGISYGKYVKRAKMAEAVSNIDAISKAQATFFLTK